MCVECVPWYRIINYLFWKRFGRFLAYPYCRNETPRVWPSNLSGHREMNLDMNHRLISRPRWKTSSWNRRRRKWEGMKEDFGFNGFCRMRLQSYRAETAHVLFFKMRGSDRKGDSVSSRAAPCVSEEGTVSLRPTGQTASAQSCGDGTSWQSPGGPLLPSGAAKGSTSTPTEVGPPPQWVRKTRFLPQ